MHVNGSQIPEISDPFLTFSYPASRTETDPILTWQGRKQGSLQVTTVSFHSLLTIDPPHLLQIISNLPILSKHLADKKIVAINYGLQSSRSDNPSVPWINRVLHGDSLMAMANLVHQGYHAKVQMIYMDPPFGINFQGQFQSGTQKVEGYLDNWVQGLSSYLSYLRNRLVIMQQLLTPEGSIFVQIGEQNLHYVRCLLDEIFGRENFVSQITFRTAISTNKIQGIADYLLWYARDKPKMFRRKLFTARPLEKSKKTFTYSYTDPKTGNERPYKPQELVKRRNLAKSSRLNRMYSVSWNGKTFTPPEGFEWRWDKPAMDLLAAEHRISEINGKLYGMRFESDFPAMILTNVWNDTSTSTFAAKKHYAVHTNPKVIRRCMAMSSRPGDLILDPTSGSGTTAVVAETLGRRWIVCDTSPASIMSTTNWLLGTLYPTYKWDASEKDFEYKTLKKISLSNIAHSRTSAGQFRYDEPRIQKRNTRLPSSFQIEMLNVISPRMDWPRHFLTVLSKNGILLPSGETAWCSNLIPSPTASEDLKNKGFFSIRGKVGTRSLLFLVGPSSGQSNEDYILENVIPFKSDDPLILCASFFSRRFISALIKAKVFPKKVFLVLLHPDLIIGGLSMTNHSASLRLSGYLHNSASSSLLRPQFIDPVSLSAKQVSKDQIMIWGEISGDSANVPDIFQIPFYSPFLAKNLHNLFNNPLMRYLTPDNSFIFGCIPNGCPFFGL